MPDGIRGGRCRVKRFWLTILLIMWWIAYIVEKYLDEKIYKLEYPEKPLSMEQVRAEIRAFEKKYPNGFDLYKMPEPIIDDPIFRWWDREKE